MGIFPGLSQIMNNSQAVKKIPLTNDWHFYALNNPDIDTFQTSVPGTVHTDLYEMGVIKDPFFGNNEQNLKWIENETWVYETTINIPVEVMNSNRINLIFEGLDTYADIYVNNRLLRRTDNMFRSWSVSLTGNLHPGDNQLRIVFHPAKAIAANKAKELPYFLPTGEANFVRKAQYHFGWDWGPRFPTVGIWKPVYIEYYSIGKIGDVHIQQKELSNSRALLKAALKLDVLEKGRYTLNYLVHETGESGAVVLSFYPEEGVEFDIEIEDPKLWNCNGYGEPNLYTINIDLFQDDKLLDSRTERFGLRTAELVQTPDSLGSSFYFSINDKPVYAKGANMIPLDVFLPRVQREDYERLIDQALDANFNMLRVWGGGVYEDDYFYQLCDEKGIMVWQDFMFACALYPADSAFLATVSAEISEQVKRLRNHPSIVLWCGNNEIDEAWHNWQWQKHYNYTKEDSLQLYANYQHLFHELIPSILEKEDSSRTYHPSSPTHGWGRAESYVSGDQHYWGVWWGKEPFERYREKVGRFASEFGFQSFPSSTYFSVFVDEGNEDLSSAQWKNHQKHPTGFETIAEYMKRDYKEPTNLADYAYVSQLVQARGMKIAIEAQRTRQPYCMGSLYWQFNDCWPVVSWSSVDYFGVPKATHYAVKRAFKPILFSVEEKEKAYSVSLVTENILHQKGTLILELVNFEGEVLLSNASTIELPANSSAEVATFSKKWIKKAKTDLNQLVLKIKLETTEGVMAENLHYFLAPKELKLRPSQLTMKWISPGVLQITNTNYLAKDIFIESMDANLSDNYFDLLARETKTISFTSKNPSLLEYWMKEEIYPAVKTLGDVD